jgi:hypothetical protein
MGITPYGYREKYPSGILGSSHNNLQHCKLKKVNGWQIKKSAVLLTVLEETLCLLLEKN